MKVAIIGAGLSGLSAAHLLNNHANISIFEKARGVGGRMSTRQADSFFLITGHSTLQPEQNLFKISFSL